MSSSVLGAIESAVEIDVTHTSFVPLLGVFAFACYSATRSNAPTFPVRGGELSNAMNDIVRVCVCACASGNGGIVGR